MKRLPVLFAVAVVALAAGVGIALAASASTGTNTACATATATSPAHTIAVDGSNVATIKGGSSTAQKCTTVTYTVPTVTSAPVTQTVTTPGQTVTAPPVTVTSPPVTVTQTVTAPAQGTTTTQTGTTTTATTPSTTTSTPPTTTTTVPVSGTDCFADPGGCGFPDPIAADDGGTANVGATTPCALLPVHSGDLTATTNGQTVSGVDITGSINVDADNVSIKNVCITPAGGDWGIAIEVGANNTTISNTSIYSTTTSALGYGVFNEDGTDNVTAERLYIHNTSEAWNGATGPNGAVDDSYLQAGGCSQGNSKGVCGSGDHNEDVYIADEDWAGNHNTLLNSQGQTAIFFGDDGAVGDNHWTVTNSLLAGGGYAAYWDAKATSAGTEKLDIENNRWARCTTGARQNGDGHTCGSFDGSLDGASSADQAGYFPYIGYYGGPIDGWCNANGAVWTGNVYDDNNTAVPCD